MMPVNNCATLRRITRDHQVSSYQLHAIKTKAVRFCQPAHRLAGEDRQRLAAADESGRDEEDHLLPKTGADEFREYERAPFDDDRLDSACAQLRQHSAQSGTNVRAHDSDFRV